jgi:ABC-type sugar transport system ATPase subunit
VSGVAGPTAGRVEVFGELAEITSPREGAKLGIQVVHQEQKLTNEASIAENISLTGYSRLGACGEVVTCRTAQEVSHRARRPDPPYGHR